MMMNTRSTLNETRTPFVGVVIVSYNAATAVRATLASLRQAKNNTRHRVILVDNASDDLAREKIVSAFRRHVREAALEWEYVQQDQNLGFSGGNNIGIARLLEDPEISHICLLNADVIVPDHWLDYLVEAGCDIVSAVTNKADSEQCVPVDYSLELSECLDERLEAMRPEAISRINAFAADWREAWIGNLVEVDVTFFCVLIAVPVIRKVGLLDEVFFPGGYEDDDYCLRARNHGYEIHLARDVFIHHWGSASFGQLQNEYFNERAQRNRSYLEKKHGITWHKRPEKPFVSYLIDLRFAGASEGDRSLMVRFHNLYRSQLVALLNHYGAEFRKLRSMVARSKLKTESDLNQKIAHTDSLGDLLSAFQKVTVDAEIVFSTGSPLRVSVQDIAERLERLAEGVKVQVDCNLAMHAFLSAHLKESELAMLMTSERGGGVRRVFGRLKRGLFFLWDLRGVVFFGGYPYTERQSDGYFQRIQIIDGLFSDRWRVYVESDELPGRSRWFDRPQSKVLVLRIQGGRKRRALVRFLALVAVLRCRKIYFHSVLRMRDNRFGWLMYVPGLSKVIDIHGVVPEEFRLHSDFYSAGLYEREERLAVRKGGMVIVVTEAMQAYLRQKYRDDLRGKVAIFPMFPNVAPTLAPRAYVDGKPVVVYAGGLHKWQQVPKMIDAITRTASICVHRFYCPEPDVVRGMLPVAIRDRVIVDRKGHEELIGLYAECHYGFILREDNVVNHVSCPTKLVEYLAMGIVPIVDCANIGDFKALGMQFITLSDFLSSALPNEDRRQQMAAQNFRVYEKLKLVKQTGASEIYDYFSSVPRNAGILDRTINKFRRAFPPHTLAGRLSRRAWGALVPLVRPQHAVPAADPMVVHALLESLPEQYDILVQVENFEAGGLENVVIDLNKTLMEASYRVVLLVLGNQGPAVRQAKQQGLTVVCQRYDAEVHAKIIDRLKPKMVIGHYCNFGIETIHERQIPFIQVLHNIYMWFSEVERQRFSREAMLTNTFVAVSEQVKQYSVCRLGVPEEKCVVIPNGIDTSEFEGVSSTDIRSSLRGQFGFTDDDFVFIDVGAINHQKNHLGTLRAFSETLKACPNAKLVILGPAYEKHLLQELEDYITNNRLRGKALYAGAAPGIHGHLAMADAFVSGTFFEGGPLTLLEALKANLPVIISAVGHASAFEGKAGVSLVKPAYDMATFDGAILEMQSNSAFEQRLANAMIGVCRSPVRPNLSPIEFRAIDRKNTYQQYLDLLANILRDVPPADTGAAEKYRAVAGSN
jgi:GT2 family glycosyltransferase/glycosyltransferase involved in cell wall biosynthesis